MAIVSKPDEITRRVTSRIQYFDAHVTAANREALLNEFALRCFHDVADGDYIAARLSYRSELFLQAFWASQQALEKYLKAILLFRRIQRNKPTHSLLKLLRALEAAFPLQLSEQARAFISAIENWDVDRYFIYPHGTHGLELMQLDRTIWEIRRYCIPRDRRISPKGTPAEALDLRRIENAVNYPPQKFRSIVPGFLDEVLSRKTHISRPALVWKNLYFGSSLRRSLASFRQTFSSYNSPLAQYPEIIDEVKKYVFLPPKVDTLKGHSL
jgi:tetratricopeptide (TPR) repeat protein